MKLKILAILILTVCCFNHLSSQNLVTMPDIIPMAPEVTNHIRSIEYPVSYAHGSVDISIPLYEIVVGDMTIPISISYNHKGIRPFEYTQWLGQGWSLNAEPSISRKANGKPDIHCKYIPVDDANHTDKAFYINQNRFNDYYTMLVRPEHEKYDEFPDEYYYSIPGKSGAFIYSWSASKGFTPSTIPYEQINIKYTPNSSANSWDGYFQITDDKGNIFQFNDTDYTDVYHRLPTTWRCSNITTKGGAVSFQYADALEYMTSLTEIAIIEDEFLPGAGNEPSEVPNFQHYSAIYDEPHNADLRYTMFPMFWGDYTPPIYGFKPAGSAHLPEKFKANNTVFTQRVKKITFPNGYAIFNHHSAGGHPDRRTLENIKVYDNSGNLIRTVKFEHSFQSSHPILYPVLNSVKILDGNGKLQESFSFNYYGTFPQPNWYGNNINFWGYYSAGGDWGHGTLIHRDYVQINFMKLNSYEIQKDYHFFVGAGSRLSWARTDGVLRSISTLTGAVTEFEYESDIFTRRVIDGVYLMSGYKDQIVNSGGLRIKTIRQSDHTGIPATERHFKYGENESGVGFARINITPDEYISTQKVVNHLNYLDCTFKRVRTLSSHLHGDVTLSGVPIVYDYVTEYIKGFDRETNQLRNFGKTVYKYNYSDYYDPYDSPRYKYQDAYIAPEGNIPVPLRGDDKTAQWNKGELLSKQVYKYDENNGNYDLQQKTEYVYTIFDKDEIKAGQACIIATEIILGYNDPVYTAYHGFHIMRTGCKRLGQQKESFYTDNGILTTKTDYKYDNANHLYPTKVTTTRSDGTIHGEAFKYPQDIGSITDPVHADAISNMLNKGIYSPVIEHTRIFPDVVSRITYNHYKNFDNYYSSSGWPLPSKLLIKGSSVNEQRIVYHNYDLYGNPLYATKDNITNVVYLWGYSGQYLVAVIENATYQNVANALGTHSLESFSINQSNYNSVIGNLRSSNRLKNALITTFKYKPLIGIVEITDPRGVATFYDYDTLGRLTKVSDDEGNPVSEYHYHTKNN